jgi:hypothetical protein
MTLAGLSLRSDHSRIARSMCIHGGLYRESGGFKIRGRSAQPRVTWLAALRASIQQRERQSVLKEVFTQPATTASRLGRCTARKPKGRSKSTLT